MIYLDNAAATPMDERVLAAMMPYLTDQFVNPSASYQAARLVRADYEAARHQLAMTIGARPAEIILTAGATESVNIALNGVTGRIITTAIEHPAVLNVARARDGIVLAVDKFGQINLDMLKCAITDDTELISIGYVNSETGMITDIKATSGIVASVRSDRRNRGISRPLLLHTDASQAAGILDLNVARLGVDLMTLNAGKCYGPKQVGLLYVRAGTILRPFLAGGGQEMGLRSGTENVAGAVGFAKALTLADKTRASEVKRLSELRSFLKNYFIKNIAGVIFNENPRRNSPGILNFSVPGLDGERMVFALDEKGVAVATGSACAANKGTRSHVLTALGLSDLEVDGSIRLSLGRLTVEEEIKRAAQLIVVTVHEQMKFGVQS